MPLYDFKCPEGHTFEASVLAIYRTMKCRHEDCEEQAERQPSAPAVQFKGSGFYATDYKGK